MVSTGSTDETPLQTMVSTGSTDETPLSADGGER
jgi:hypothetical protein